MRRGTVGWAFQSLLAMGLVLSLFAADQDDRSRIRIKITNMEFRTIRSPKFAETTNPAASIEYEWLQVCVDYETEGARRGWADEVTLEWAVLVRPPNSKPLLLQESASYIDVADGKHHAVMFVRPAIIRRYCDSKSVNKSYFAAYVEIGAEGQRLARQEYSRSNQPKNWWRAKEPDVRLLQGELLPLEDTPFAAMDYDFYEHPKRKRQ